MNTRGLFRTMKTICLSNEKGGVAKSTTAGALTTGLMLAGKKTLLIDADIQGNLTRTFGADPAGYSVMDLLKGSVTTEKAIQHTDQGDIVPSSRTLATAELELFYPNGQPATARERGTIPYRLKRALDQVSDQYDFAIIDTPPTLGVITTNALTASNSVIIPCEAEQYSLDGLGEMYKTIQAVRQNTNPGLEIEGLLIVRFNKRTILSRQLAETLIQASRKLQTKVFSTPIRETTVVKESHSMKQDIYRYAPKSNATADYKELVKEILLE